MNEQEERIQKLQALENLNINPYPARYKVTHLNSEVKKKFETDGQTFNVSIAGRILLKRVFGKALFMTLEDESGKIQIYAQQQNLDEKYSILKKLIDLGDIIGVQGSLFRTQKGEITVQITEFEVLAKSLNPYPDKFHGISNTEMRYRQRYIDLMVNSNIRDNFMTRSLVIKSIRDTLHNQNFIEVETPVLQAIPGGANARPFITHHNALNMDFYLRIATELHLKRVITGGIPRVFEIGRIFRNEGISTKHNPEFTSVEIYEAYGDMYTMINLTENIITDVLTATHNTLKINYQNKILDFTAPYQRLTMLDSIKAYGGIDVEQYPTYELLKEATIHKGVPADEIKVSTRATLIYFLFEEFVEKNLQGPVFITHYPHEVSPLSKQCEDNPEFTERFELFVDGKELANSFSEQNDPRVQKEQFQLQVASKEAGDLEAMFYDEDYINCLEYGMPPTGGLGIGIDRLTMFVINTTSIRDTILFPHMKNKEVNTADDDDQRLNSV